MNTQDAKRVLETALICAQQPLTMRELRQLFGDDEIGAEALPALLDELAADCEGRGIELLQTVGGWRYQSRPEMREFLGGHSASGQAPLHYWQMDAGASALLALVLGAVLSMWRAASRLAGTASGCTVC